MKRGNITLFNFKQAMLESGLENQNAITITPKISAKLPRITWDQTVSALKRSNPLNSDSPLLKLGIITVKIKIVCKIKATTVR